MAGMTYSECLRAALDARALATEHVEDPYTWAYLLGRAQAFAQAGDSGVALAVLADDLRVMHQLDGLAAQLDALVVELSGHVNDARARLAARTEPVADDG